MRQYYNRIINLNYIELKSFLDNLSIQEDFYFEWKGYFNLENDRLRKLFSAFANTDGGYIFFGIGNNKEIIGIEKDNDLNARISRIVDTLHPGLFIGSWKIIKTIEVQNDNKIVYIVCVYPNLFKPHIFDKKIYIRRNGVNKEIDDGRDIREMLLINKFHPEHIILLEKMLDTLKTSAYGIGEFDFVYFQHLKMYLYEKAKEGYEQGILLKTFLKIENMFTEIHSENKEIFRSESTGAVLDNPNKLEALIKEFIEEFKQVHNL